MNEKIETIPIIVMDKFMVSGLFAQFARMIGKVPEFQFYTIDDDTCALILKDMAGLHVVQAAMTILEQDFKEFLVQRARKEDKK